MANQRSDSPRNVNPNRQDHNFQARCSDISGQKCDWHTSGRNEDEVMHNVEQHGREHHGINMTTEQRDRAREVIRGNERRAA